MRTGEEAKQFLALAKSRPGQRGVSSEGKNEKNELAALPFRIRPERSSLAWQAHSFQALDLTLREDRETEQEPTDPRP